MKSKKSGFVIQCKKTNRRIYGYPHKKGIYINNNGRGAKTLRGAYMYDSNFDLDSFGRLWHKYYHIVPVTVTTTIEIQKVK